MKKFEVGSILFIKLDHIGDMILATPVFKAVKEKYPDCKLGVLCSSKGQVVLMNNPYVDDVFVYNPDMFDRGNENNEFSKLVDFFTILEVRNQQYDVCINLREDHENVIIQKMAGAKFNISFSTDSPYPQLLDYSIPNPGAVHAAKKNFALLELIDVVQPFRMKTELFPDEADLEWADNFLKENSVTCFDKLIVVCPGGGWFLNWWPWENYAKLCDDLCQYNSSFKVILVGGSAEKEVIASIKKQCSCQIIDACGKTTLQQLSALCSKAKLVVCNDGGPMHVASTAQVPIIAMFGPSPRWFYPVGEDNIIIHKDFACSPCPQFQPGEKPKCLNNKCMKLISEKEVLKTALEVLEGRFRRMYAE